MKRVLAVLSLAVLLVAPGAAQPQNATENAAVDPGMVPGNPLYPLESFVEKLEVRIAGALGGKDLKAKAMANNAEEHLAEANTLIEQNRTEKAAEMVERYSREINRSQRLADSGNDTELSGKLRNISRKNIETLEKVQKKVPEKAQKGIQNAIENSRRGADRGINADITGGKNDTGARHPLKNKKSGKETRIPNEPGDTSSRGKGVMDRPQAPENTTEEPENTADKVKNRTEDLEQGKTVNETLGQVNNSGSLTQEDSGGQRTDSPQGSGGNDEPSSPQENPSDTLDDLSDQ